MNLGKIGADAFEVGQAFRKNGNEGANAVRARQLGDEGNLFDKSATQKAAGNGYVVERGNSGDYELFR